MRIVLFMYFIVVFILIVFIPFLGNVGSFAYPTSYKAVDIVNHGSYQKTSEYEYITFWIVSLRTEEEYPAPSMILGILKLISGMHADALPFIPASGVIVFLFSYLLFKELYSQEVKKLNKYEYVSLLFLISVFDIITRNTGYYVGRAALGTAFLMIAVYLLIKISRNDRLSYVLIFLVFFQATWLTYYTATLAVTLSLFMLIVSQKLKFIKRGHKSYLLHIFPFTLAFTALQPIISALSISPLAVFSNLVEAVLARLGLERETYKFVKVLPVDLFVVVSNNLIGPLLKFISYSFLLYYFISRFISRRLSSENSFDIFTVIVIGVTLTETLYATQVSTLPLRFLTMFSVFYLALILTVSRLKYLKMFAYLVFITLLVIHYTGHIYYMWNYGLMFSLERALGILTFLLTPAPSYAVFTGDEVLTGYLFFKLHVASRDLYYFTAFHARTYELLGPDPQAIIRNVDFFRRNKVEYLLIPVDSRPVCGDAWGYCVIPHKNAVAYIKTYYNIIYSDKFITAIKV